ncbi:hypothetical protein [Burkholderia sp. Bp8963]|uniref:hypothetical protein n=1 Tax=Burkholderia sp. Bp8963 TaxID=2184547 RepID=UPI000F596941|nr:hypothetical protein [Burkholderia sp. Bp8963]
MGYHTLRQGPKERSSNKTIIGSATLPAARQMPINALGNAAREALRLADVLGEMLAGARAVLVEGDRKLIAETRSRTTEVILS